MTDNQKPELGLLIHEKSERGYFHITIAPIVIAEDRGDFKHAPGYGAQERYRGILLDGLRIDSQGNQERDDLSDRAHGLYGFDVRYHDVFTIDLRRALDMAKSLGTIERKLEKLRDARGAARSFSEYVGRVAEVLGASRFLLEKDGHDWGTFRGLTLGSGRDYIHHVEAQWKAGTWKARKAA